jgi:ABC-2 type transport system permease protein
LKYYLHLTWQFFRTAVQNELAYRSNWLVSLLNSALSLGTGLIALTVLFNQLPSIQGWTFGMMLALLGVYLTMDALRNLVLGPSLEALAGIGGEVGTGQFDFTLLRPANIQFLASLRHWHPLAILDLLLGLGVIGVATGQLEVAVGWWQVISFIVTLAAGLLVLYAILLAFTALVFWSYGFLFTWVFNGIFQLARYPLGIYPGWLRLVLTWIIPVGIMTTVPAQALSGQLAPELLFGSLLLALALFFGASVLFRTSIRHYSSASS